VPAPIFKTNATRFDPYKNFRFKVMIDGKYVMACNKVSTLKRSTKVVEFRAGGDASFETFLTLSRVEELAWRTRIEGSRGIPEREFNGAVRGWQDEYRAGVAALGSDFATRSGEDQDARLDAGTEFKVEGDDLLIVSAKDILAIIEG